MQAEKIILNKLLDKYERSSAFSKGESARRVMIDAQKDDDILALCEEYDSKREFLAALSDLKEAGLINYSWVKYEEGNLVSRIWLMTDSKALAESYRTAGRVSKADKLKALESQLLQALREIDDASGKKETSDIRAFMEDMLSECRIKKKIPRFFSDDSAKNEHVLRFLCVLEGNRDEKMERVVSNHLYGDSKYFERELKNNVVSILRQIAKNNGEDTEDLTGEDLLLERGITRWPEVMEFRGPVQVCFDFSRNLNEIDYSGECFGAYINTDAIRNISSVSVGKVSRVITIENKANYIWYIRQGFHSDELVIYHGGCFSPMKGKWIQMLVRAAEKWSPEFLHWSDIDAGGFRIFTRLRREIIPELKPFQMDPATMKCYRRLCQKLGDEHYRRILIKMLDDPEYAVFHEAIRYMLKEDVRLEQEAEIG